MTVTFAQPADAGTTTEDSDLAAQMRQVIITTAGNAPRSRQATLGPSEAGIECTRRLAYRMLEWPIPPGTASQGHGPGGDPWPSIVGTATHAWLADAFSNDPSGRWLVEQRLTIAPPILPGGSCDLYDTWTDTVIDHKIVGTTSMRTYKAEGPRHQYKVQAHIYGLGWELTGRHPKRVALAFMPRGGLLTGMWLWSEPYDRRIALSAIKRLTAIRELIFAVHAAAGKFEDNPTAWDLIPAQASHSCAWCPWYRPGSADPSQGCPGDLPPRAATTHQAQ